MKDNTVLKDPKIKICWECKFFDQSMGGFENLCLRNMGYSAPSLITGISDRIDIYSCYEERYKHGACGEEGYFWEPKP